MTRYVVSFETVIDVVNADDFTEGEIVEALRRDFRREVEENGIHNEDAYLVTETIARPDYGLRLVRGPYFIDAVHPDDPVALAPKEEGG